MNKQYSAHVDKILKALIHSKVIEADQVRYELGGVFLLPLGGGDMVKCGFESLEEFEVYIDPKDEEIKRLKSILEEQQKVISKLSEKKANPVRKAPIRLTRSEQAEVAQYAIDNPKITTKEIANQFGISNSYCGKILHEAKVRIKRPYGRSSNDN